MGDREERRVKMNRMRLRIAERLKQSQNTAAALTTFNEVDMSSIMEFRKLYKDAVLEKTGVKLGFMSAFTRAAVLAMRDLPIVNASIEGPDGGDTIVFRDYVDVSVAVATDKGLVTPVVRNVQTLDMIGIEKSIADLGKKVRFLACILPCATRFSNGPSPRRVTASLRSRTWLAAHSPSATEVYLARSWAHPSSICPRLLSWVSTPSRTAQLS